MIRCDGLLYLFTVEGITKCTENELNVVAMVNYLYFLSGLVLEGF